MSHERDGGGHLWVRSCDGEHTALVYVGDRGAPAVVIQPAPSGPIRLDPETARAVADELLRLADDLERARREEE